ncbi:ribosomal protein L11 methyltransferase [Candidatus Magnetomoraceae bacterium gMMP-1]
MKTKPYEKLHIYYLEGILKYSSEKLFKNDFIGNWEEDGTSFLFFPRPADDEVAILLKFQPELKLLDQFQMTYDEWHGGELNPIQAGPFIIIPPWKDVSSSKDLIPVLLDPGVVFGTGTHPTTYDCLSAISLIYETEKPETVLDIGTGTGLLALGTASMGARKILAIDLNFLAAKTALKNVCLNKFEKNIVVIQADARDYIDMPCDLLVTNIHYDILKDLIKSSGFLNKKNFILSGLMRSQGEKILRELADLPVKIIKKWGNTWYTFWGKSIK